MRDPGLRDAAGFELLATQDEVRRMDALAIDGSWAPQTDGMGAAPIAGRLLMELAGAAAARLIRERAGGLAGKAVVLCGPGNNGGDGWVVARHLLGAGWTVRCVALAEPRVGSDAHANMALWKALGGDIRMAERGATARMKNWLNHANTIVDGLFGTGLARALEGAAADLVTAANAAEHGLKVALDLPSGIDGDSGNILGAAFRADLTATFGIRKRGLYLAAGPDYAGEVVRIDIGWVRPVVDRIGASLRLAEVQAIAALIPTRPAEGHKGSFGHVGIVGGFPGTEGAAVLAARGALRAGAGLVTWSAPEGHEAVLRPPELMRVPFESALPERPTVIVVGPGLGSDQASALAVALTLADDRPQVWDADALNAIAANDQLATLARNPRRVLTPHPLEAARLLGQDAKTVQADRIAAAQTIAKRSGTVVLLKGRNPIVASPDAPTVIFDLAEPTLAVGGSGDVLAGIVGALLAQGLTPRNAALVAVYVHGQAGVTAGLGQAQRGAFASDIADAVPAVIGRLAAP